MHAQAEGWLGEGPPLSGMNSRGRRERGERPREGRAVGLQGQGRRRGPRLAPGLAARDPKASESRSAGAAAGRS